MVKVAESLAHAVNQLCVICTISGIDVKVKCKKRLKSDKNKKFKKVTKIKMLALLQTPVSNCNPSVFR